MLSYIHWGPEPEILTIGDVAIRWYSVLFGSGILCSYKLLHYYFSKKNIDGRLLDKLFVYVFLAIIIGARLGHCLFYDFQYYSKHPIEIFLPFTFEPNFEFIGYAGLASHGAAVGILVAVILVARRNGISIIWLLDQLALVIPLGGLAIRIGNLMNSEIVGKVTDVPWAFVFAKVDQLPRHPAQLYEAIAYALIFGWINYFYNKGHKKPGFLFGLLLTLLFSARFLIEFVKEPQSDFEVTMVLNMGQLLSIPFILAGLLLLISRSTTFNNAETK
jgi:phosphatidylglycerol---prolipoprotein diacylglyceryl transferase